jgi:hypothetical protein
MKKFLIILLIVFIVFNSVHVPEVYAVGNMIINNPYNKQLIAKILIASGVVYTTATQLEESVEEFIERWNDHETGWTMPTPKDPQGPNTWEAIIYAAIAVGSIVYDITTGTFKQILELTEDFVDYVKQFVDENYDAGERIIPGFIDVTTGSVEISPGQTLNLFYPGHGYAIVTMYKVGNDKYIDYYVSNGVDTATGTATFNAPRIELGKYAGLLQIYRVNAANIVISRIGASGVPWIDCDTSILSTEDKELGYGDEDIVDNPEYEYKHNETGNPTIVMPIQFPVPDESGYFVPSEDLEDLIGVGADDIANERTDGIIIPAPTPTPSPEPVSYPELPGEDIATEYDYDTPNKRALYQLKFPFSLPWDIKAVFQLLNAPAKAPYFEIDIIPAGLKDKIGITGETEFVFDMEDFELIGQVSRFFSFIGFCLTLIYITRNIIKS